MILHIDADAFFVACEVSRLPHLKGKAVIVDGERGIACAMSYEAKALGVTRGMPVFQIKKKFPEVIILPAHFDLYNSYRDNLVAHLKTKFTHIEVYSIDECFIEVNKKEIPFTDEALDLLQKELEKALGIPYSVGLARTKTLAKIASKKNKPRGAYFLTKENETKTLANMNIESIWGIGRNTAKDLSTLGVKKVSDFLFIDNSKLEKLFSVQVIRTKDELLGIKRIKLEQGNAVRKSMQVTRSFARNSDASFVLSELSVNIESLCSKLTCDGLFTDHFTVWIKEIQNDGKEVYFSKEIHLEGSTQNESIIFSKLSPFYDSFLKKERGVYRTTGVHALSLKRAVDIQLGLFETDERKDTGSLLTSVNQKQDKGCVVMLGSLKASSIRVKDSVRMDKESHYLANLPYPYLGEAS